MRLGNIMLNLDDRCGSQSSVTALSYIDAAMSVLFFLISFPCNGLIVVTIFKYRHLLHRSFYLIIANIALADFAAAIIVAPLSISFHVKEGLGNETFITFTERATLHYTFFLTNGVAVLSMAVLSIDRLGVLVDPFFYYEKMTTPRITFILVASWLISVALTYFYFQVGYIRYLAVFTLTTVTLTTIIMVTTMIIFKKRLRESERAEHSARSNHSNEIRHANSSRVKTLNNFTKMDKRITSTFLIMLVLFLVNYLPLIILIIYINACQNCSCMVIHICRDMVFLSILSSGMLRAINFITRISALQEAIKSTLSGKKKKLPQEGFDFRLTKQSPLSL